MKIHVPVAFLCALGVVSCSSPPRLPHSHDTRFNPKVVVKNGRLSVSPDPIYFASDEKGEITWTVQEGTNFRFPPKGIVIEGKLVDPPQRSYESNATTETPRGRLVIDQNQDEVACAPQHGGRKFVCINRHYNPGIYKYTMRVYDGTTVIEFTATIMNM
jgi:hypothetical protein